MSLRFKKVAELTFGALFAEDSTVALCLGTYVGPMEVGVSYERGTPVT